jgi:myo-inositol-1(or 4)-monophosphatase
VIDPIDGTRNFVRHIPLYSCSIAAMLGGTPLVGAVYDIPRDIMYSASRDGGLFVNGDLQRPGRATVSDQQTFSEKRLVALPSSPRGGPADIAHEWLDKYVCRILGSTALHLALVASGELSGTVADNPRLWDIAAGWVLIHATGGRMVTPDGEDVFPLDIAEYRDQELPVVAANAEASDELLPR